jgi:hypothetical protein
MSSNVVYAFLSFRATKVVTTLEVLHSLLFQFIFEDPDLQSSLCEAIEAKHRQFASSIATASEVFKELLGNKTIFFVIDGLDEISERGRASLLESLFHILEDSPNAKILISSRGEHDLTRLIEPRAEIIRLHDRNGRDVKEYVQRRTGRWLRTLDLCDDIKSEIRQLLSSIAEKSKGKPLSVSS